MQYPQHFELKFQVLIVKINGLLCIVQVLLWQNKISSSRLCIAAMPLIKEH